MADAERLRRILGDRVVAARAITDRGYTPNRRWVVELAGGRSVFVKQAVNEETGAWLRTEHAVYSSLGGSFLPESLGWDDDGATPMLVLENLSDGEWPPPWTPEAIEAVQTSLAELHRVPAPADLPAIEASPYCQQGWRLVAEDPGPFLSLGLCTHGWLDRALPALLGAADSQTLAGRSTLHLDVRSDNVFLRKGRAVLFDWNHAAIGNPEFDIAFWLPSLRAEGGPLPERVVADLDPAMAAHVAGFFAARAGQPPIPDAPGVRGIQLVQLRIALPWAARVLGLPALT